MECRALIVIGASAGGLSALETLVGGLPRDLEAAVCVVLHIGSRQSIAPAILDAAGPLPVAHAVDGEPIQAGRVYLAPPDHHLLVAPGCLYLSRGPRENRTRPAIDPLFRSSAHSYGQRVIGVILSGTMNDGTAGFSEIKRCGGTSVVQDPAEARFPGMPRSALLNVAVDHCVPILSMAGLLVQLTRGQATGGQATGGPAARSSLQSTGGAATPKEESGMEGDFELNAPATLTCPECGGAMKEAAADSMPYYTCHIGHRFGVEAMDEAQFRMMEQALEVAVRALNERAALCGRLMVTANRKGHSLTAQRWERAGQEARQRADLLLQILRQDWTRPPPDPEESATGCS